MFSGIIEEAARIARKERVGGVVRLTVESGLDHSSTALGDSIAIDGVCLTVVGAERGRLQFELLEETLRRTTLENSRPGDRVNLERSLQVGGRLHGHFVFGHVDGTTELLAREPDGACDRYCWRLPSELRRFVTPKGSISISGISLTVGEVKSDSFSVYIIPHTASVTTLGALPIGGMANLEIDMLARYVVNACGFIDGSSGGAVVTEALLKSRGYIGES